MKNGLIFFLAASAIFLSSSCATNEQDLSISFEPDTSPASSGVFEIIQATTADAAEIELGLRYTTPPVVAGTRLAALTEGTFKLQANYATVSGTADSESYLLVFPLDQFSVVFLEDRLEIVDEVHQQS